MAKKFILKFLPHPDVVMQNRWIKFLGPRLQDPSLWHINRRSCSSGVAIGVFCAFIPIPFQMVIAGVAAILLRFNVLVSVSVVWVTNPLTMVPLFYFCYLIGVELLGVEPGHFEFQLSFGWLVKELGAIWQPFLLGCFAVGAISALCSFILVRVLWHLHLLSRIKERAQRLHFRRRQKP